MPDKTAGTIFVVQKMGYTLKGRVLRPAQVGVVADTQ
jgi:molecular chaperone GrpE